MNALDFGGEALTLPTSRFPIRTVLDIGAGVSAHTTYLRQRGFDVTTISWTDAPGFKNDTVGDYNSVEFEEPVDAIWASNVLEHQPNHGAFLRKIHRDLQPGGVVAITVRPAKPNIVVGHLTLWNAGMLLYNLIMAGFDCRGANVRSYGYNISVMARKRLARLADDLVMDRGDIERLAPFFSFPAEQDFDGNIAELNWDARAADRRPIAGPIFDHSTMAICKLKDAPTPLDADLDLHSPDGLRDTAEVATQRPPNAKAAVRCESHLTAPLL